MPDIYYSVKVWYSLHKSGMHYGGIKKFKDDSYYTFYICWPRLNLVSENYLKDY